MLGGVNITATTREHAAEMLGRRRFSRSTRPRRWRASVAMPPGAGFSPFSRPRLGQFSRWQSA